MAPSTDEDAHSLAAARPRRHPFEYQPPTPDQTATIQAVRAACMALYDLVLVRVPSCAERTLAIRKLEEASMWVNKAVVFDGERYVP